MGDIWVIGLGEIVDDDVLSADKVLWLTTRGGCGRSVLAKLLRHHPPQRARPQYPEYS
jgi:hypothetical protein